MKTSHILSFTLSTFNIMWGKPGRGGAPTSWLVRPLVADLAPIDYINYSAANSAIRAPTHTLCVLHQSTWLSAQHLTPARRVECMCVVPGVVTSNGWAVPAYNAWVVAGSSTCSTWVVVSLSAVSSGGLTRGIKPAISWGWILSSHFFMDLAQILFFATSIASWPSHAFLKMHSLMTMFTQL